MIIQNHCSNKNFLPNGIIHRSLNSYLRTVLYGVVPSFIVSNQASRAKPHKHSKSRRMSKFASFVLTEMMHMEMELDILKISVSIFVDNDKISQQRKNAAKERKFRQRKSWAAFQSNLTDRQFRRYFRMSKECFDLLCDRIKSNVGEREFKSEVYLKQLLDSDLKSNNILKAHKETTGGFISGEIKLALILRLLAGGCYLDLALLFEMGFTYSYVVFHNVIGNWILDDRFVKIDGAEYCSDVEWISSVALDFSRGSKGVINGCIGALDGWIVKIIKPRKSDGVHNPSSFFSRKGFFGINVQAIVDKKKRILYRSIQHRGAEHDSTAFKNSSFYKWLVENWPALGRLGFYFVGDSAYSLKSFLLTPYDNVMHGSHEDNYNFFHSSSRITVECAFGEVDLRWGIFWKPLRFSLVHNCRVIDAAMRLHNFIVDFRENTRETTVMEVIEREVFDDDVRRFLAVQANVDESGVQGGE